MLHFRLISFITLFIFISLNARVPFIHSREDIKKEFLKRNANLRQDVFENKFEEGKRSRSLRGEILCKVEDPEGNPLSEYVYFLDNYGFLYNIKQTVADSSKLQFTNLFSGKYTFGITGSDSRMLFLGGTLKSDDATFIEINGGESIDIGKFIYDESIFNDEPLDTVTISGVIKIVKADTIPLKGSFSIQLRRKNSDGTLSNKKSVPFYANDDGSFSRDIGIEKGEYLAMVTSSNWQGEKIIPFWINGESFDEEPTSIVIDSNITNLQLYAREGGSIVGRIYCEDGDTLAESVRLLCISEKGLIFDEATPYKGDTTFVIGGLPDGDYYIMLDNNSTHYVKYWYYPGTNKISEAQKISIVSDKVDTLDFTVKKISDGVIGDGGAIISGKIMSPEGVDAEGWAVDVYFEGYSGGICAVGEGANYSMDVDVNRMFRFKVGDKWSDVTNIYKSRKWHNDSINGNTAENIELSSGEVYNANINLEWAGSIAGFIKDANGVKVKGVDPYNVWDEGNDKRWEITNSIMAEKNGHLFFNDGLLVSEYIDGGYRASELPPGTYSLAIQSYFVGMETAPGELLNIDQNEMKGVGNFKVDNIIVSDTTTTFKEIKCPKNTSGIINGIYTAPSKYLVDDYYYFYAFNADGVIQSYGWTFTDLAPVDIDTSIGAKFIEQDLNTLMQKETGKAANSISSSIILPRLKAGEYYVMALFVDSHTGKCFKHWYGIDTTFSLSNFQEFDSSITIPSGAKKILLSTDSSVVTIDFDNTPIVNKTYAVSPLFANVNLFRNTVYVKYNLTNLKVDKLDVSLINTTGRTIWNNNYTNKKGNIVIDADSIGFANGVYIIRLKAGKKVVNRKINLIR